MYTITGKLFCYEIIMSYLLKLYVCIKIMVIVSLIIVVLFNNYALIISFVHLYRV